MKRIRVVWTGISLLLALAAAPPAGADQLQAPGAVVANLDGSFSYLAKFRKEGVSDFLGGYGWSPLQNVNGGFSADCFCETWCNLQPGDSLSIGVSGQLVDPTQPGTSGSWVSFCTPGANYGANTIVYPFGTTSVGQPPILGLALWNAPNPVASGTTLHWVLPSSASVRLRIFDLAGRQVASLVDETQSEGHHSAFWDVKSLPGRSGGGIYFARLTAGAESRTRVIVLRR